jgi:hypothetical protein
MFPLTLSRGSTTIGLGLLSTNEQWAVIKLRFTHISLAKQVIAAGTVYIFGSSPNRVGCMPSQSGPIGMSRACKARRSVSFTCKNNRLSSSMVSKPRSMALITMVNQRQQPDKWGEVLSLPTRYGEDPYF